MRSMMYSSIGGRGIEMNELADKIGMAYAQAPSVFGFYSPDYSPGGLVTEAGMVSPEVIARAVSTCFSHTVPQAQIGTAPFLVGLVIRCW